MQFSNGGEMTMNNDTAVKYLEQYRALLTQIEEAKKAARITQMEEKAADLKSQVTKWAIENEIGQIELEGAHATLIKQRYGGRWIAEDEDITENDPAETMSLRRLIEKKFKSGVDERGTQARKVWLKITRRIVDPALIDVAVVDGILRLKDIEAAYVEKEKVPYLRIFNDS
jgi:hypothetical protein